MTTCDRCGAELKIGDYPFCKRGPKDHVPADLKVIGDDIPGGILIKHGLCHPGGAPRRFYSKSEIAAAAKAKGLEPFVRHVGTPGSDKNPHTQRWV